MSVTDRFDQVYIGDEFIRQIVLDIPEHTCKLMLSGGSVYRLPIKAFDYEITYQPAELTFIAIRSVNLSDYVLNAQIVDYELVEVQPAGYYKFSLTMTGGWDNDTFMRTIEIIAKDFSLTGTALPGGCP